MARQRGNEIGSQPDGSAGAKSGSKGEGESARVQPQARKPAASTNPAAPEGSAAPGLPDALRRLIALGLSGMFATQETLRQTVGDALPKEWVDFAADQSERTRKDFLDRLAGELARTLESIDLARVMQQALEGRTLEVNARIRMLPDDGKPGVGLKLSMKEDEEG